MASMYLQRGSDPTPGQRRRRSGAMLLAIAAHLLLILLLLRLAPSPADRERAGNDLKTFAVTKGTATKTATKHAKAPPKHATKAAKAAAKPRTHPASHSAATPGADASAIWALGRGLYKGSDIAAIPSAHQGEAAAETADAGGGDTAGSPGAGPGGRTLYNAEWYTEPTDAEMRPYFPRPVAPSSWGMIACQTAPHNRVENCRELSESPSGAGLTRALRQAAWQFKVLPPRVDGKPMIGAWVRIRFDFTDAGIQARR